MKRVFVVVAAALLLSACTDKKGATEALESSGLKPVDVGGYAWLSCDTDSDVFATKFTAVNATGQTVSGAVCSGWFKGKTIRYN